MINLYYVCFFLNTILKGKEAGKGKEQILL